jgi:mono/diheme cytochrome c family protein
MRSSKHILRPLTLAPLLIFGVACGDSGGSSGGSDQGGEVDRVGRGKHYYQNVCIACHAGDPNEDGFLGPALAGTPLEVIEAKVMRGEYPEGYTPKRNTLTMPRFEFLGPELANIAAYLESVKPQT